MSSSSTSIVDWFNASNETLFGADEIEETTEYYANLCKGHSVEVKYVSQEFGKGLFATQDFKPGDVILTELGLVMLQSTRNKATTRVCQRCLMFLGNPVTQVEHVLGGGAKKLEGGEMAQVNLAAAKVMDHVEGRFRPEVNCGCGEWYCSEECKESDKPQHQLLCPEKRPEAATRIETFKDFSVHTNEIFVLAAKIYARVGYLMIEKGESLQSALAPFRKFVKGFWWEVCEPDEGDDEAEFRQTLKNLLEDSLTLLKDALREYTPQLDPIMTLEFFGLLIGMFELNNLAIITPSPLVHLLDHMPAELASKIVAKANEGHDHDHDHDHGHECSEEHDCDHHDHEHEHGDDLDGLLADGTALHPLQATINHSCEPNAMVYKDEEVAAPHLSESAAAGKKAEVPVPVRDGRTVIRACKAIKKGEEIFISYLDDGPLEIEEEDSSAAAPPTVEAAVGTKTKDDANDDEDQWVDDEEDEAFAKEEQAMEREWRARSLKEYGIKACNCKKCRN